jgi:hypothetical protein
MSLPRRPPTIRTVLLHFCYIKIYHNYSGGGSAGKSRLMRLSEPEVLGKIFLIFPSLPGERDQFNMINNEKLP